MQQIWEANDTWTGLAQAGALQLQGRKATQELKLAMINPDHFA